MAYYSYLQFNTVYCTWHKTAMTVLKAFKKKILFPIHRKFTVNEVSNENTAKKKKILDTVQNVLITSFG